MTKVRESELMGIRELTQADFMDGSNTVQKWFQDGFDALLELKGMFGSDEFREASRKLEELHEKFLIYRRKFCTRDRTGDGVLSERAKLERMEKEIGEDENREVELVH